MTKNTASGYGGLVFGLNHQLWVQHQMTPKIRLTLKVAQKIIISL
jgi:hypothetical protein